jgi:cellulose 1,4-beta-cellobiosidase
VYKAAGSPSQFRGIATNVAGWNSWYVKEYLLEPETGVSVVEKMREGLTWNYLPRDAEPGEFANDADGQYNKAQNEKKYHQMFGAALADAGMPNHAIVDTGEFSSSPILTQKLHLVFGVISATSRVIQSVSQSVTNFPST